MKQEQAKKIFEQAGEKMDFGQLKGLFGELTGKIEPTLRRITEDNLKITKPKAKKNISLNKVNVGVSLIEDGRVMINLPTLDDATQLYDSLNNIDWNKMNEYERLLSEKNIALTSKIKENADLLKALQYGKEKPWYKRLFNVS